MKKQKILPLLLSAILAIILSAEADARRERSESAKTDFKRSHPCPVNGNRSGSCPGYVIDHVAPIACGGADAPSNMQWQTVAEGKVKDKWERKGCTNGVAKTSVNATDSAYHTGPRGGCYTYNSNGKKRYVDHSNCR